MYSWAASHPDATGRGYYISPTSTANCPNVDANGPTGGCTPGGDDGGYVNRSGSPFVQTEDRRAIFNRTVIGATLHVNWNFDAFSLTSVTDYLRLQKRYGEDSDISPNWTGIAGLRYTSDQKTFDYEYFAGSTTPAFVYNPSTNPEASKTFDNVTAKLELDYKLDSESMLYGSVNRGAKGGGWSAPSNGVTQTSIDNLQYKQEILTSYELGEKLTFWDGRARLNGAVFYYDYQDYQGFSSRV